MDKPSMAVSSKAVSMVVPELNARFEEVDENVFFRRKIALGFVLESL